MAPSWLQKLKRGRQSPARGSRSDDKPILSTSPAPPAPSPANGTARAAGSELLPLTSTLQEQLWTQAYEALKADQTSLVDAYERILSSRLDGKDPTAKNAQPSENKIANTQEQRWHQMKKLVDMGREKTKAQASIKGKIGEGMQAVDAVKGIIDKAVQASPQASAAWVGVCFGLEVSLLVRREGLASPKTDSDLIQILSNPITESKINRDGIVYVLLRMKWYWNLASLLLDENKVHGASEGLRDELKGHVLELYQKLLAFQMKSACLYHRNWATIIL
jgi:hypothetical protein